MCYDALGSTHNLHIYLHHLVEQRGVISAQRLPKIGSLGSGKEVVRKAQVQHTELQITIIHRAGA